MRKSKGQKNIVMNKKLWDSFIQSDDMSMPSIIIPYYRGTKKTELSAESALKKSCLLSGVKHHCSFQEPTGKFTASKRVNEKGGQSQWKRQFIIQAERHDNPNNLALQYRPPQNHRRAPTCVVCRCGGNYGSVSSFWLFSSYRHQPGP